jgi:hypothetical protein
MTQGRGTADLFAVFAAVIHAPPTGHGPGKVLHTQTQGGIPRGSFSHGGKAMTRGAVVTPVVMLLSAAWRVTVLLCCSA